MKSKAKVVVVGGGVVGVSALYHLAKKGWSDVVLVERKELTSGSTWHAAGLLPLFNMSYSVGQLHKYAVNLYKKLEEEVLQHATWIRKLILFSQSKQRQTNLFLLNDKEHLLLLLLHLLLLLLLLISLCAFY